MPRAKQPTALLAGAVALVLLVGYGLSQAAPPSPPGPPGPASSPSPGTPAPAPNLGTSAPSPRAMPAEPVVITVNLTLAQEVPTPRPETPRTASGMGAVVISAARTQVGFAFTFSGLSGPLMSAHFHRGYNGEAGSIVQTICGDPRPGLIGACPSVTRGAINGATSGMVAGVWRIPQAMLPDLQAGRLYVNFHTALNPGGEIRGQIPTTSMTPGPMTTMPPSPTPRR